MKLFLVALLLLVFPTAEMALTEYNGHFIEFEAILKDGSTTHGFVYKAHLFRLDAEVDKNPLAKREYEVLLNNEFMDGMGKYAYFKNKIKYTYKNPYQDHAKTIYQGIDKARIELDNIESFTIIKLIPQTYAIGISSSHTSKDLKWMTQKPVQYYSFGGKFCSQDIYIHKTTQQTEATILALEKLDQEYRDHLQFLELEMRGSDGSKYYDAEKTLDEYDEAQDAKVSELLDGFSGEKVVVISMCTC